MCRVIQSMERKGTFLAPVESHHLHVLLFEQKSTICQPRAHVVKNFIRLEGTQFFPMRLNILGSVTQKQCSMYLGLYPTWASHLLSVSASLPHEAPGSGLAKHMSSLFPRTSFLPIQHPLPPPPAPTKAQPHRQPLESRSVFLRVHL